jgi:hypothetical protein
MVVVVWGGSWLVLSLRVEDGRWMRVKEVGALKKGDIARSNTPSSQSLV